jgi:hypothetical protein
MLVEYLFVYSEKDGSFPERLRIIRDGQDLDVPDLDELTGTVNKKDVEGRRTNLKEKYPAPKFRVATSWANTWRAVQHNFAGLDYEYNSRSSASNRSTVPASGPHPLGKVLLETAASRSTKVIFLFGTVMFFGVVAVVWPEFSARFGGLFNWFRALAHNPSWALPAFMVPASLAAGVILLLWFIYYLQVKVTLREHGILFQPGGRSVRWDEVEHLTYAQRRLRVWGIPLPMHQSLSLQMSSQRPLNLPHRFKNMESLVALVREHAEPFVLRRVEERLRAEGSVSFGKQITITSEDLKLNNLGVAIPLSQVNRIAVHGGTFQIFNQDNRVIYSRLVESIPDATVVSDLLAAIRHSA